MGDFHCKVGDSAINAFIDTYKLVNLIKNPTCHETDNQLCIDLILTNYRSNFKNSTNVVTALSDLHLMIRSILNGNFLKRGPKLITHRDYKTAELICDDRKIAELFNNHFLNITQYLKIQEDLAHISITNDKLKKKVIDLSPPTGSA